MTKETKEIRAFGTLGELREESEGKIVGYAAVFNSPTTIGGWFREQIAPGAFTEAIEEDDVRALVDHDSSLVLGRNKSGTLALSEDDKGLRVEIDPPDTQLANDLKKLIERGDVTQMSFGFRAESEQWDDDDDDNELPLRTVLKARLFDVSVVTYPAYTDTEVAVRSLEAFQSQKNIRHNTARKMKLAFVERGEIAG